MENSYLSKKKLIPFSHIPTFLLLIGYPVFWFELFFVNTASGMTSSVATGVFLLLVLLVLIKSYKQNAESVLNLINFFRQCPVVYKISFVLILLILSLGFQASLLPPHLTQECDALNYHYSIPRQHLILNSFSHIGWSTADLFPLPIQCALAPFWFATALPNKIPQFIFFLGLIAISVNLMRYLHSNPQRGFLVVVAILGSHNFGIQMGTAMLDLVICYLFLAFIDSLLAGRAVLAAAEFVFLFWAKSFLPLQLSLIILILCCLGKWIPFQKRRLDFVKKLNELRLGRKQVQIFIIFFVVFSIFVGGPFVVKSLGDSGTPLYPFAVGCVMVNDSIDVNSASWKALLSATQYHMQTRNQYGRGRSFVEFIRHLWLVAVPERGVNNSFDYPLGLPFLIFAGPFLWYCILMFKEKCFSILGFFVIIYWATWWMGSQQSRFLYIPMVLIFITVIARLPSLPRVLTYAMVLALMVNAISMCRAHKSDMGQAKTEVLRPRDREMVELSREYLSQGRKDFVEQENHEVAFAQFPVRVVKDKTPFIIFLPQK